jgi:NAD kinase
MTEGVPTFQHIAVAPHPQIPVAIEETEHVVSFLRALGVRVDSGLLDDETLRQRIVAGEFDLLIALGGDGTMLRASQRI